MSHLNYYLTRAVMLAWSLLLLCVPVRRMPCTGARCSLAAWPPWQHMLTASKACAPPCRYPKRYTQDASFHSTSSCADH
jgi:hypothetical protein